MSGELWSKARRERARRFCILLARGYARLERAPKDALALAQEAGATLPNEIEAKVLGGRALLRLGETDAARQALATTVFAPGRPLGDVSAIRELGVALASAGQLEESATVYRVLVPRVDFVKDRLFARLAVLEASAVLMASSAGGASEAALYLGEARRGVATPGFQDLTVALLALALDREGKTEQAAVVLEELSSVWGLERFLSERDRARVADSLSIETAPESEPEPVFRERMPVLAEGELHAAIGVACARSDPKLAAIHLAAFLESPAGNGPYASWAKKKLAGLGGAPGAKR